MNDLLDWSKRQGTRTGRKGQRVNVYAEQKKSWEEIIWAAIRNAHIQPIRGSVTLLYLWKEPNKRRNPSNIVAGGRKFIEDALVRAGILHNDGWKEILEFTDHWIVDKKQPGVRVTLVEKV